MSLFPRSEHKILKLIYENPGIRLNELLRQASVSVGTSKKRLDFLIDSNIIREERITSGKKIILKTFYPVFESDEGRSVFSLIEAEKRTEFFKNNKNLIGPFRQLLKNIDSKIRVILIFGSYASHSQTRDSDLDILFLISNEIDTDSLKKEIERSFITFNQDVSPRIDTLDGFKKNISKEILQSIIRDHVIVKGNMDYFDLIAESVTKNRIR